MPSSMHNTSSSPDKSTAVELIFLGTGTSSSVPHVECLTYDPAIHKPCKTCLSTLTPEGKKNMRRNTGAVLRTKAKDGRSVTIVIDAGKTFQAAALEWFPRFGLRKIDALLITHAHADAMNGLDDLRGWTLNGAIQPYIDVYLSQATFTEVQRSFPYLVSKEFASGGGDVPDFKYHIINDREAFEIEDTGIEITPFAVHHGRIFSKVPPPAYVVTPTATLPSTPTKSGVSLPSSRQSSPTLEKQTEKEVVRNTEQGVIHPLLCFGFKIREQLAYISDVSHIPDHIWEVLRSKRGSASGPLPALILDCLRLRPHTSHLGIAESVGIARRIGAARTYLTGFSHEVAHEEYITITEAVGGGVKDDVQLTESERKGTELIQGGDQLWVRPAHDGLRLWVGEDNNVYDESY
ncbi:hypothetical protein P691DRAFT_716113 [Macrolepiota fuliginosa MF-IS2]|uniref:Metallo-beta-lactamase domain-containing protein n=1 Tax=Macrolepiota fuliginosa MF-IS2 TaxID=1400762 RepID=A0A9P5XP59_9AGAR|nr:hypothetical protein P691DRAFT_716113 [Macrolepiota fuliginosa MF-IS2]